MSFRAEPRGALPSVERRWCWDCGATIPRGVVRENGGESRSWGDCSEECWREMSEPAQAERAFEELGELALLLMGAESDRRAS